MKKNRKFRTIAIPELAIRIPQLTWEDWTRIAAAAIIALGLIGYYIGDLTTPEPAPAPEPTAAPVIIYHPPTEIPTQIPTTMPTTMPTEAPPPTAMLPATQEPAAEIPVGQLAAAEPIAGAIIEAFKQTTYVQDLPVMSLNDCNAAGAARGWSSTWGNGSDGCWLISPDGSQVEHVGYISAEDACSMQLQGALAFYPGATKQYDPGTGACTITYQQ